MIQSWTNLTGDNFFPWKFSNAFDKIVNLVLFPYSVSKEYIADTNSVSKGVVNTVWLILNGEFILLKSSCWNIRYFPRIHFEFFTQTMNFAMLSNIGMKAFWNFLATEKKKKLWWLLCYQFNILTLNYSDTVSETFKMLYILVKSSELTLSVGAFFI